MRKYLIWCENSKKEVTGAWVEMPSEWTGDQYGELQDRFRMDHGIKKPKDAWDRYAQMTDFWETTDNGIKFDWELAGPHGASFFLLWLPENTKEQIEEAANLIRSSRDAVRVKYLKVDHLIEYPLSTLSKEV
jgi:hypothetical protein